MFVNSPWTNFESLTRPLAVIFGWFRPSTDAFNNFAGFLQLKYGLSTSSFSLAQQTIWLGGRKRKKPNSVFKFIYT